MNYEDAMTKAQYIANMTRMTFYVYSIKGDFIIHPYRYPPTQDAVYSATASPEPSNA